MVTNGLQTFARQIWLCQICPISVKFDVKLMRVLLTTLQAICDRVFNMEGITVSEKLCVLYFNFFCVTVIRHENSAVVVEHMVCGLNTLCRQTALNSRAQVCRIGEEITEQLLFMWSHRAAEKLKVHSH